MGGAGFFIFENVKRWMVFVCVVLPFLLQGQINLVPNPSFEIIDTCPYSQDQLHFAPPWYKPTPNSTDLYNACSSVASCTVPENWTGTQQPRTGNGYAGIGCYGYQYNGVDNRREYLSVQLNAPLVSGRLYCAEFYASYADSSYWAINRLGMHFSNLTLSDNLAIDTLAVIPQITWDTSIIITDTQSWIRISGIYQAVGGEQYITIGNFYADDQTDTIGQQGNFIWAYFYIDDVAVYELVECNAGNDFSICYKDSVQLGIPSTPNVVYEWTPTAGLSDPNISNPVVSPDTTTFYVLKQTECDAVSYDTVRVIVNQDCHRATNIIIPTIVYGAQEFFIAGLESNSKLELYDVRGRLIFSADDYENNFQFLSCEQTVYCAVLTRPNGEQLVKKVLFVQ